MNVAVELLAEDVERLRRSYPDLDARRLADALFDAALPHRDHDPDPGDIRDVFIHDAAAVSTYRLRLSVLAGALDRVGRNERLAYEAALELDRHILPPLKQEAQGLRRELFALEAAARARGIDPSTIEPSIPEAPIAVDDYEPPRFADAHDRREATVAFFRRLGGDP